MKREKGKPRKDQIRTSCRPILATHLDIIWVDREPIHSNRILRIQSAVLQPDSFVDDDVLIQGMDEVSLNQ